MSEFAGRARTPVACACNKLGAHLVVASHRIASGVCVCVCVWCVCVYTHTHMEHINLSSARLADRRTYLDCVYTHTHTHTHFSLARLAALCTWICCAPNSSMAPPWPSAALRRLPWMRPRRARRLRLPRRAGVAEGLPQEEK